MSPQRSVTTYAQEDRETLVFGRPIQWGEETRSQYARIRPGGTTDTESISVATLETLLEDGYIDPNERHNNAPTVAQFYNWGSYYDQADNVTVAYRGYMIGPERPDTRISITEICVEDDSGIPDYIVEEFEATFDTAEILCIGEELLTAWWD